ncbi:MAG: hypothetical protein RRY20_02610 [Bilophila sp.]
MVMPEIFTRLLDQLVLQDRKAGGLAIACSGGLDSRFLTHAACLSGVHPALYHVTGPHVSARETAACVAWAQGRGLTLHVVTCDPLCLPEVLANTPDRCYACKRALFSRLYREVGNACLCDGSNASDLKLYRPGLRALRELDISSPLAEAGLDKDTIRTLAHQTGLENPDQPSRPCLLTRLAYGVSPTPNLLAALDACEVTLETLLHELFPNVVTPEYRVRHLLDGTQLVQLKTTLTTAQRHHLTAGLSAYGDLRIVDGQDVSGYFDRNVRCDQNETTS